MNQQWEPPRQDNDNVRWIRDTYQEARKAPPSVVGTGCAVVILVCLAVIVVAVTVAVVRWVLS